MDLITDSIQNNKSIVYAKYGDGEYYAAINMPGMNIDRTPFTPELGIGIINSFTYLTQIPTVHIGKREELPVITYFQSLVSYPIQWMDYNLFFFNSATEFIKREAMYRAIRDAKQQKIYICNKTLVDRSKDIFKIDKHIVIDKSDWFQKNYETIRSTAISSVKNPASVIFLLSAGMGAKVLIADLYKQFPNAIILDIGSALDLLCGLIRSRDYHSQVSAKDINGIYRTLLR